jgi:hypothetical protein
VYPALRDCAEGLYCDTETTGECLPLPGPGSPCRDGACAPGAWCDTSVETPICAALKVEAAGCTADVECESTWCRNGTRCAEPIEPGEVCVPDEDRCVTGHGCRPDYPFCARYDALICQTAEVNL